MKRLSETGAPLHNKKKILSLHPGIEIWCNGSTTDFGSVCPGSNPGISTIKGGLRHPLSLRYLSSYHPVALRQPSRARGMVSPNPLRSLRSLLMRKPPFIVEIPIVVPPCFAPPRGVLGEALLLRSLTLRIGVACATPLFVEIMSYNPVALRQPSRARGMVSPNPLRSLRSVTSASHSFVLR